MTNPDALGSGSLAVWYKADAITGISDGGSMTGWVDSSGNGWDVDTIIGTAGLYRATGGPNGMPCVDHSGAVGGFDPPDSSAAMPTGDYTYFLVTSNTSVAIQSMLNARVTAGAQIRMNNRKIEIDQAGTAALKTSTKALSSGVWTLVLVTFTSVGSKVYFNISNTIENYNLGGTSTFAADNLSYGSYQSGGADLFNGKMAEIGMYSSVLPFSELMGLRDYLIAKYALPAPPRSFFQRPLVNASRGLAVRQAPRW